MHLCGRSMLASVVSSRSKPAPAVTPVTLPQDGGAQGQQFTSGVACIPWALLLARMLSPHCVPSHTPGTYPLLIKLRVLPSGQGTGTVLGARVCVMAAGDRGMHVSVRLSPYSLYLGKGSSV